MPYRHSPLPFATQKLDSQMRTLRAVWKSTGCTYIPKSKNDQVLEDKFGDMQRRQEFFHETDYTGWNQCLSLLSTGQNPVDAVEVLCPKLLNCDIILEILNKFNSFEPIGDPDNCDVRLILLWKFFTCLCNYYNDNNGLNFMCTKFKIPTSVRHCSPWLFKVVTYW